MTPVVAGGGRPITEPPAAALAVVSEPLEPGRGIATAVEDLYRGCHLPAPSVIMARSAPEFVRIVMVLGRDWWPAPSYPFTLVLCSFGAFVTGWFALHDFFREGLTPHTWIDIALITIPSLASIALAIESLYWRISAQLMAFQVLIGLLGPTALAAVLGFAIGGGEAAVVAIVVASVAAALAHLGLAVAAPVYRRWSVRRAYKVPVPLLRVRPLHDVVRVRLRAARDEAPEASSDADRGVVGDRLALVGRLEALGRHRDRLAWHTLQPFLGAGSTDPASFDVQHAMGRADERPHVLRAAARVHGLTDAATLLDRVAVVMPAGTPLDSVPSAQLRWRRSTRSPYREALGIAEDGPWPGLGIDLAWSDEMADRLLAHHLSQLSDAGLRDSAIRAMRMDRFMLAARLRPIQRDAAGELYVIGPALDPLVYVKVTDASPGPSGAPRLHWLSVPAHVATARSGSLDVRHDRAGLRANRRDVRAVRRTHSQPVPSAWER